MNDDDFDDVNELYLHYKTKFGATRIIGNVVYPTTFKIEADVWLDMDDLSQEEKDFYLNLTLVKIDFFFKNIMDNSIIFGSINEWAIGVLIKDNEPTTDNILVKCPLDPSDDHLAMILQSKMSALSKGHLMFGSVTITSNNSKGLRFTFVGDGRNSLPLMEEWVGERSYFDEPWWCRDDASTFDIIPFADSNLDEKPDFAFDLDFLGESLRPVINTSSANIIRPKFKPTVVVDNDK